VVDIKEYSVEMELDGQRFLLGINAAAPPPARDSGQTGVEENSKDKKKADADQAPEGGEEGSDAESSAAAGNKADSDSS
jgi:hypothetical protein